MTEPNEANNPNNPDANSGHQNLPPNSRWIFMIKVVGIFLIIFGAVGVLSYATSLAHPIYGHRGLRIAFNIMNGGGTRFAFRLFGLFMMGCFLSFGIIGVINAGKAAKAQNVIYMGLIMCALLVIDLLVTIVLPMKTGFPGQLIQSRPAAMFDTIFVTIYSFVLPVLYIVYGNKNKKSLRAQP